jgi:hypothetical protein
LFCALAVPQIRRPQAAASNDGDLTIGSETSGLGDAKRF